MGLSEQLARKIPDEAKLNQEMTHQPVYNPWPDVLQKVDAAGNWINEQIPSMEVPFDYQPGGEEWIQGHGYNLDMANLEKATELGMNMIDPGAKAAPGVAGIFYRSKDAAKISEAEALLKAGMSPEEVWKKTLHAQAPWPSQRKSDGPTWISEIDDSGSVFDPVTNSGPDPALLARLKAFNDAKRLQEIRNDYLNTTGRSLDGSQLEGRFSRMPDNKIQRLPHPDALGLSQRPLDEISQEMGNLQAQIDAVGEPPAPLVTTHFQHDELLNNPDYASLQNTGLEFDKTLQPNELGWFAQGTNRMGLNTKYLQPENFGDARSTIVHELAHGVQGVDNLPRGGSPESEGSFKKYQQLTGEALSRAAQDRIDMSMEDRMMNYPFAGGKLADIPIGDLRTKYRALPLGGKMFGQE